MTDDNANKVQPLNNGKIWFASAVVTNGNDIRCRSAWSDSGPHYVLGYLVEVCRKDHPAHAIVSTQVIEVNVKRAECWRDIVAAAFLGASGGFVLGVTLFAIAVAI